MVVLHITGNSYNSTKHPINSLFQFYDYGDGGIIQCSGLNLGEKLGELTVYRHEGKLYAYIQQTATYQTLSFALITNQNFLQPTLSNAGMHTLAEDDIRVNITPKNVTFEGHTHGISDVNGLQSALDEKSYTNHSHTTHLQATMSNKDLNTIKSAGWYYGYTGMTNAPTQQIAVMEVLVYSADWVVQRFIVVNGAEYIRHWHSGNTWSDWKTNIDSGNIGLQSVERATKDANNNVITNTYETKSDAAQRFEDAKSYTNSKILVAANKATVLNDLQNNTAYGDYSIAAGIQTQAGCKGYYIKAIDPTNRYIYLATDGVECIPTWTNPSSYHNTSFNTNYSIIPAADINAGAAPIYANEFSISSIDYFHWVFAANIEEISGNRIKYSEENILSQNPDTDHAAYKKWMANLDGKANPMKFYIPYQSQTGNIVVGNVTFTTGLNTLAADEYSVAEGRNTLAVGFASHAEGDETRAGYCGHAEGYKTYARGLGAHTEGQLTEAAGNFSHAEGSGSSASGKTSHAEGYYTKATGDYAHAEGSGAEASGMHSHAQGLSTLAKGARSHAGGHYAHATGRGAFAHGLAVDNKNDDTNRTLASGEASIAMGRGAQATLTDAVAIGKQAKAKGSNAIVLGQSSSTANNSIVIGHGVTNSTADAIVIGKNTDTIRLGGAITIGTNSNGRYVSTSVPVSFNGGALKSVADETAVGLSTVPLNLKGSTISLKNGIVAIDSSSVTTSKPTTLNGVLSAADTVTTSVTTKLHNNALSTGTNANGTYVQTTVPTSLFNGAVRAVADRTELGNVDLPTSIKGSAITMKGISTTDDSVTTTKPTSLNNGVVEIAADNVITKKPTSLNNNTLTVTDTEVNTSKTTKLVDGVLTATSTNVSTTKPTSLNGDKLDVTDSKVKTSVSTTLANGALEATTTKVTTTKETSLVNSALTVTNSSVASSVPVNFQNGALYTGTSGAGYVVTTVPTSLYGGTIKSNASGVSLTENGNGVFINNFKFKGSTMSAGAGVASGYYSIALGGSNEDGNTEANADCAISIGTGNKVGRMCAFSVGTSNKVGYGKNEQGTQYSGAYSFALGKTNEIRASYCYAMGASNKAFASNAHVFGTNNEANGTYSFAHGNETHAEGSHSVVFGHGGVASGTHSLVMGSNNEASAQYAFAFGSGTKASANHAIAFGSNTAALAEYSRAEGVNSEASGIYAYAGGDGCTATGTAAYANGWGSYARGNYSFAHGHQAEALASYSVAFGRGTQAGASGSFVFGDACIATADTDNEIHAWNALAGGSETVATHSASFALGRKLQTVNANGGVIGQYNEVISNPNNLWAKRTVLVAGNGSGAIDPETGKESRSNAHIWYMNGDSWHSGTLTAANITSDSAIRGANLIVGSIFCDDRIDTTNVFAYGGVEATHVTANDTVSAPTGIFGSIRLNGNYGTENDRPSNPAEGEIFFQIVE